MPTGFQLGQAAAALKGGFLGCQLLGALHPAVCTLAKSLAELVIARVEVHQRPACFVIAQHAAARCCIATRYVFDVSAAGQNCRVGLADCQWDCDLAVKRCQFVEPARCRAAFGLLGGFHLVLRIKVRPVGHTEPGSWYKT